MIIKPRVRGFMCITTHPAGCEENVRQQIEYVKSKGAIDGPKKVTGNWRIHRLRPGRSYNCCFWFRCRHPGNLF
jgi:Uncharacterized paraquat-inducible protein B